jgi:hypothetical protein
MPKLLAKPRKKQPKRSIRQWFTAAIAATGPFALVSPQRGGRRVVVELGEEMVEKVFFEPFARLAVNIGDHLILCGPTIEETQGATVKRIQRDGDDEKLHVTLGYGGPLAPTTTTVHVMRGIRATSFKQQKLRLGAA